MALGRAAWRGGRLAGKGQAEHEGDKAEQSLHLGSPSQCAGRQAGWPDQTSGMP